MGGCSLGVEHQSVSQSMDPIADKRLATTMDPWTGGWEGLVDEQGGGGRVCFIVVSPYNVTGLSS